MKIFTRLLKAIPLILSLLKCVETDKYAKLYDAWCIMKISYRLVNSLVNLFSDHVTSRGNREAYGWCADLGNRLQRCCELEKTSVLVGTMLFFLSLYLPFYNTLILSSCFKFSWNNSTAREHSWYTCTILNMIHCLRNYIS